MFIPYKMERNGFFSIVQQLEVYKMENIRLKEENGALIRVISKLSK